jgi:hypothetical protein
MDGGDLGRLGAFLGLLFTFVHQFVFFKRFASI